MTQFEPVTLPTAESAVSLFLAAIILAKVSGRDVPRATRVIPVTEDGIPQTHPNKVATSPTTKVIRAMNKRATKNAGHPPLQWFGGTKANITFQKICSCKFVRQSI